MIHALPIVQPIHYDQLLDYFKRLAASGRPLVYLDSASAETPRARYSYLAYDPFDIIDNFAALKATTAQYKATARSDIPPFQGGLAGYFSYDWGRELEVLPNIADNTADFSAMEFGVFDLVLSFDHLTKQAWLISTGFPALDAKKRYQQAQLRRDACLASMASDIMVAGSAPDSVPVITADFSSQGYQQAVNKIIDYIRAGDIFEANLSQRFSADLPNCFNSIALYQRLRSLNPAPFGAYLRLTDTEILSSSPERFLTLDDRHVESRPIKGTIHRAKDPVADQRLAEQLKNSDKDRAENTMIVDLMRNDLSRVCQPHSIKVPQFCGLETYENVHHLVSVIVGELAAPYDALDLLKAAFPGGSITGAPKIRAMEIIESLEPVRRGPYCGSAVWIGFDGRMDSSILIRTYVIKDQKIYFQGGGAVVLDSDPQAEYQETLVKVAPLQQALSGNDTDIR